METDSFSQSVIKRAYEDTEKFRSRPLWFWGVGVVGSGAITGLTIWMLGDRSTLHDWQVGSITFVTFVLGLFLTYGLIFLLYLFRAPYRQRNEARHKIEALEAESEKYELFDVLCQTTSLKLPINWLRGGGCQESSIRIGPKPITILHRGDLTEVTHFILFPVIIFTLAGGWKTTNAIQVTPGNNPVAGPLAQSFTWNTQNPEHWVLNGLPLPMAKDDKLPLPPIMISVADGKVAGTHFENGGTCSLLLKFAIRTDKGIPQLPDYQISLMMSNIKDSFPIPGSIQRKLGEGSTHE